MALIYKRGFPADHPHDTAREIALAEVARADGDPVLDIGIIQMPEHEAAGEYLVRIVTGQPGREPDPEPDPRLVEREQLLARLAEIDAQLG